MTDSDTESKYSFNRTVKIEDNLQNYFSTEEAIADRIGINMKKISSEMGDLYGYLQEILEYTELKYRPYYCHSDY